MTYTKEQITKRKFDVVIIGAGGSGMRASLQLARAGLNVAVLSKVFPTRSHTVAAQGGVGASLGNMSEDNWHYHFYDTIKGSDWLGDQDAIEFMCREAPNVVYELEHFGMPFDRNPDGTIYQRPFGGHTANYGEKPVQRACAAADRTGHAMLHTLYQQNVKARTQFFVEWMALDLIRDADGDVLGVTALEMETGEVHILEAKITLLATGGAGRIFAASTNAFINTGDGLGMAARAGLPLEDMEFWQFHPTGVAGAGVLLTEGCRGEGAILRNSDGERFMERYAPTLKDLAPRDFVSRCMDQEIKEGRGCGPNKDYVVLDMTHLGVETIMKRLPSVFEIGHNFANVDITKEPIPVVPTIHYQVGGIPTNVHGQVVAPRDGNPSTVVPGLYAISRELKPGGSHGVAVSDPDGAILAGRHKLHDAAAQAVALRIAGPTAGIQFQETKRTCQPEPSLAVQGNPRDGHGNHEAAGILTQEAFRSAGDPSRFPEQIRDGLRPWQPLKLYMGGVREGEDWTLRIDPSEYSPWLGESYQTFARLGLAFQRSQNGGRVNMEAPSIAYYKRLAMAAEVRLKPDTTGTKENGFFDGIDTSIPGLFSAIGRPSPPGAAARLSSIDAEVCSSEAACSSVR